MSVSDDRIQKGKPINLVGMGASDSFPGAFAICICLCWQLDIRTALSGCPRSYSWSSLRRLKKKLSEEAQGFPAQLEGVREGVGRRD